VARRVPVLDVACLLWMLGAPVGPAEAQADAVTLWSPVEVWGALDVTRAVTAGLDTDYPAPLVAFPDAAGRGRQKLTLDPATGRGVEAGVNLMPAAHAGLQVFLSTVRADLGGENTPYQVDLSYISRPPPAYAPIPVELHRTVPWPATTGRLVQWSIAAGPVMRGGSGRVSVTGSGGLAWHRLSGHAEPLGFTVFHLGGHSTLFSDDLRVRVSFGPTWSIGGYVGGGLDLAISRHLSATAGCVAFIGGTAEAPARVDAILEGQSGFAPPPPADIDDRMAPGPARVSPRGLSLRFGIKVR
jgi:hypothetical protein